MQLFITEYSKKNDTIIVNDTELLAQLRKVLRARIGDHIWIQSPGDEETKTRYEITITLWDNKMFEGTIVHEQQYTLSNGEKTMLVAMPNKRDKVELIVQKLTECGLDQIIFWPSERSIIRVWNQKKEERLQKIIKEAVEQSRGRKLPKLNFAADITKYIQDTQVIIFDKPVKNWKLKIENWESNVQSLHTKVWVIWPEGGLTDKDYQIFEWSTYLIQWLGETILRTETAAIIGWWLLKNYSKYW